jgi:hypothetical protein
MTANQLHVNSLSQSQLSLHLTPLYLTANIRLINALFSSSLLLGSALANVGTQKVLGAPQEKSHATRPVYAIAHRVLMTNGVWDALNDGANALEIDIRADKNGWNAQHGRNAVSRGDAAELMFNVLPKRVLKEEPSPLSSLTSRIRIGASLNMN